MAEMPNPFKDFDPTKMFKDFDPTKMFDMSKLASEFKLNGLNGVDVQAVVSAQKRNVEATAYVYLGQWYLPAAMRKNIDGMVIAPAPVFWNIEKKSQS